MASKGARQLGSTAPIEDHNVTIDKVAFVACQKGDRQADILGFIRSANGMQREQVGVCLCRTRLGIDVLIAQVGVDPGRGDGIAANVVPAEAHGERTGKPMYASLGAAADDMSRIGTGALDRADIDDAAITTLRHLRQWRF